MNATNDEPYVIVTRYVRPDGRIVRHVYAGEDGAGWPSRARAQTQVRQHVREAKERKGDEFVERALAGGSFEINVVKTIAL